MTELEKNDLLEQAGIQKDCVTQRNPNKKRWWSSFVIREYLNFSYQPLQVPLSVFSKLRYDFEDTGEWVNAYYFFNICILKTGLLKR